MSDFINKILANDPVVDFEKATGKDSHNLTAKEDVMQLLSHVSYSASIKTRLLQNLNDTYMDMTWDEFDAIVTKYGFKNVYEYQFSYISFRSASNEKAALYHKDGLIIFATSFSNGTSINGGHLYGEIRLDEGKTIGGLRCSHSAINADRVISFDYDIREGLINFLNSVSEVGKLSEKWTLPNHFLWFVDYIEEKRVPIGDVEITKNKIMKCPDNVQAMLQVYLDNAR